MAGHSKHDAPGVMAGFLFQPERALYWLAKSPRGSRVGIETGDDIRVKIGEDNIYEQDKHTIAEKTNTLNDRSKDLWKTLNIWLKSIDNEKLDLNKTKFFLVTNRVLPDCISKRIGDAKEDEEIKKCVLDIREAGKNPTDELKFYSESVLSYSEHDIGQLIKNIEVCDGSNGSYGKELFQEVISYLHMPNDLPASDIISAMLGWIYQTTLELWRNRKPAWITREAFDNQYYSVVYNIRNKSFSERSRNLIPILDSEREKNKDQIFVQQLKLIDAENDEIINAIDDFLRYRSEKTRFSKEGEITVQDFVVFYDTLQERWSIIFNRYKKQLKKIVKRGRIDINSKEYEEKLVDLGDDIIHETLNHRGILAGQQTQQYYLTRGSYHKLSNNFDVGWHPDYEKKLKNDDGGDTDNE